MPDLRKKSAISISFMSINLKTAMNRFEEAMEVHSDVRGRAEFVIADPNVIIL